MLTSHPARNGPAPSPIRFTAPSPVPGAARGVAASGHPAPAPVADAVMVGVGSPSGVVISPSRTMTSPSASSAAAARGPVMAKLLTTGVMPRVAVSATRVNASSHPMGEGVSGWVCSKVMHHHVHTVNVCHTEWHVAEKGKVNSVKSPSGVRQFGERLRCL